jgi:polysaccharide export outer membrane protein
MVRERRFAGKSMKLLFGTLLLGAMACSLWAQGESASLPSTSILPSKKILPNDLVGITVFGEPELTRTVRVDPQGLIRLPLLKDQIKADGLMPEQLEKVIAEALKNEQILVDPFVTVTVAEYYRPLRKPISVVGAVRTPTTFQSVEPVTLIEAITRAGGVSPEAGSEILITPARQADPDGKLTESTGATTGLVKRVRVKSLVDATDPSGNLILTGGEEIRVPDAGHIYVFGNVKKPGTLPVEDSSDATVFKAIALSEGLAQYASKQGYIFRREVGSSTRNEIPVDLRKIVDHKVPDVPLIANDILYVPDNTGRRNTMTTLKVVGGIAAVVLTAVIYVVLR